MFIECVYLENFSRRVQGIILFARVGGGGGGCSEAYFLVSLQQMHDCVLSHKTHNRRLKLKHKKTYKKQQLGIAYLIRSLSLISNCTTCNNKIYHINTLMHWYVIHEYHVSHALKYCL